jgi:outer membrane protein TolC
LIPALLLAALLLAARGAQGAEAAPRELTLAEAVGVALAENPLLREAAAAVEAARAEEERARAERRPTLRLETRYLHLSETGMISAIPGRPPLPLGEEDTLTGLLTFQEAVFTGGRLRALEQQAAGQARATDVRRERVRQTVAWAAERAFRRLVGTQEAVATASLALLSARRHLEDVRHRLDAGTAARYDLVRAEVQDREATHEHLRAEAAREAAHADLLRALGRGEGSFRAVEPDEGDGAEERPLADLLRQAMARRPEMGMLSWQESSAAAGLEAARAEGAPTVLVTADWLLADPESPVQYDRWSVGGVLAWPLATFGRVAARVREARARLDGVRAARETLIRGIEHEVRLAHTRHRSASAEVEVAIQRVRQAEELERLAGVRFREGVGTSTEVVDAQVSLSRARLGLSQARMERGLAMAELELALGTTATERRGEGP